MPQRKNEAPPPTKHTPGPWADDEAPSGGIHSTVTGRMLIPHSVPLSPEDRALITAAPDLLAACEALMEWATHPTLALLAVQVLGLQGLDALVEAARQAIAKARGQEASQP